jgi:hypothetical protein
MDAFTRLVHKGEWCCDFGWSCPSCGVTPKERPRTRRIARKRLRESDRRELPELLAV